MRSAWRGDARNTSAPNRAKSYRAALVAIISMAQQARPKVAGQSEERRAQLTIFSTVVVRIPSGTSSSRPIRVNLSWLGAGPRQALVNARETQSATIYQPVPRTVNHNPEKP